MTDPTPRFRLAQMRVCDCGMRDSAVLAHADTCVLFACDHCGARTMNGDEHFADCAGRCQYCGSEGRDNDHKDGCITIGTCAQCNPRMPRADWHPDVEDGPGYSERYNAHIKEFHPELEHEPLGEFMTTLMATVAETATELTPLHCPTCTCFPR